ncbi:MAG: hypothetical protein V3T61_11065 [Acidobacteriota bacterium]
MKRMLSLVFLVTLTACSQGPDDMEPSGEHPAQQLGTVHFATSCREGAQAQIERGVALLHHMTYGDHDLWGQTTRSPILTFQKQSQAGLASHPLR